MLDGRKPSLPLCCPHLARASAYKCPACCMASRARWTNVISVRCTRALTRPSLTWRRRTCSHVSSSTLVPPSPHALPAAPSVDDSWD
eukprot:160349-Hanusia_phi.AAC.1